MTMLKSLAFVIIISTIPIVSVAPFLKRPNAVIIVDGHYFQTDDNIIQGLVTSLLSQKDDVRRDAERRLIEVAARTSD